jgi:hypothetical protein
MYRKTYGIYGLLEWHGFIESHGVKMKVHFTNGSVTAHGVAPATFTTSSKLTQHIIENSEKFKSGRIFVVSAVELPTEAVQVVNAGETVEVSTAADKKEIKVNSLAEAKDYLVENHGIAASKLRSRAQIMEQAASCGIEFTGI